MRFFFLLLLGLLPIPATLLAADASVIAVIVPRTEVPKSLSSVELSLIFLKKKLYWADGKRMQPVNLSAGNPIRQQFSQRVMGNMPETQADYWNNAYFHGISPPRVVNSQEAMLRFVAETSGSIGYVDACKLDSRVRAVAWIDASGTVLASTPSALNCGNEE